MLYETGLSRCPKAILVMPFFLETCANREFFAINVCLDQKAIGAAIKGLLTLFSFALFLSFSLFSRLGR